MYRKQRRGKLVKLGLTQPFSYGSHTSFASENDITSNKYNAAMILGNRFTAISFISPDIYVPSTIISMKFTSLVQIFIDINA